ncbi:hypothetical protein BCR34DRAFT_602560 [Clohesyomyces aquaticus]|uniref:Uncharacterized protein n=1 Tax=Clohesyomyces aquaticus TaxID=1231657 RepID=A0A1Y1ZHV4_9PLEO|nr:hypothetical protein BCR34DRAFT_602560 [Clohesyomyces aquaticus]
MTRSSLILFALSTSFLASAYESPYDLGGCRNALIEYGDGYDGKSGMVYRPKDKKYFPHDADPNFNTIADFLCTTLRDNCYAPDATYQACLQAKEAGNAAKDGGVARAQAFDSKMLWSNSDSTPSSALPTASKTGGAPEPTNRTPIVNDADWANVTLATSKESIDQYDVTAEWVLDKVKERISGQDCIPDKVRITRGCDITFDCHGAEGLSLLELVKKQGNFSEIREQKTEVCYKPCTKPGQEGQCCGTKTKVDRYLTMPKAVRIRIDNIPPKGSGRGVSLHGWMNYDITCPDGAQDNCKYCKSSASALGALKWIFAPFGWLTKQTRLQRTCPALDDRSIKGWTPAYRVPPPSGNTFPIAIGPEAYQN